MLRAPCPVQFVYQNCSDLVERLIREQASRHGGRQGRLEVVYEHYPDDMTPDNPGRRGWL